MHLARALSSLWSVQIGPASGWEYAVYLSGFEVELERNGHRCPKADILNQLTFSREI